MACVRFDAESPSLQCPRYLLVPMVDFANHDDDVAFAVCSGDGVFTGADEVRVCYTSVLSMVLLAVILVPQTRPQPQGRPSLPPPWPAKIAVRRHNFRSSYFGPV